MRDQLKQVLEEIKGDAATEARWLNTLSLLEYIGARKIGKTMCQEHPSAVVLDHWADETRHAYALKRLCDEVAPGQCEGYLGKEAAVNYFQKLDEQASRWLGRATGGEDTFLNYLVVTTLVERRAMMVYPLYRAATEQGVVRDELQKIIVEEQDHRVELEERAVELLGEQGLDLDELGALEADLFGSLIGALADELDVH